MTLWPISMLSRIFERERAAVPPVHAGGRKPANRGPRPATSRPRWARMRRVVEAAPRFGAAVDGDETVDVVDVALAEVRDDAGAYCDELLAKRVKLLGREDWWCAGHGLLLDGWFLEVERYIADRY